MPEFCVFAADGKAGRAKTIAAATAREAEQLMLKEFPGTQAAAIPLEEMAGTTPAMALWNWLQTLAQ